jgi:DNA-binding NarL/FixJ family response regulator
MIRVAIADDHEIFRDGLKLALMQDKNITVVGEASNGVELIKVVRDLNPDIVLTDIVMPEMDGIAAVHHITATYPHVGIIALSMLSENSLVVEILEAGALGYLIKNADKLEIIDAINAVFKGNPYYCSTTSSRMIKMLSSSSKFDPYKNNKTAQFTETELKVIKHICEELASKEIAYKLDLSTRTIEGYRTKIMGKIGVKTPAGIAIYAIKKGIYNLK